MVMQIAWGIFVGFLLIGVFCFLILAVAYFYSKQQEKVPKFMEKPKKPKKHATVEEWWDDYDDI